MKTHSLFLLFLLLLLPRLASAAPDIRIQGFDGVFWQAINNNDLDPTNQQVTDFDTVDYNSYSDRRYRIQNQNADPLTVFVNEFSPSSVSPQFTFPGFPTGNFVVPGNDDVEFTIRYTPVTAQRTTTIRIESNDPDAESVYQFAVTGEARGGEISLHYEPAAGADVGIADGDTTPTVTSGTDFGTVSVGGTPVTRNFYIRNNSTTDPLTLANPDITGSGQAHFQLISLGTTNVGTGGTRNFQIRFDPTTAGVKTATFTVQSNDLDESPYTFTITGEGTAFPEIALEGKRQALGVEIPAFNPIGFNDITAERDNGTLFDDTTVGEDRDTTIRISNSGNAPLTLSVPTAIGANSNFRIVGFNDADLPAGATRNFTLRFSPVSSGLKTATFSMVNNDSNENPYEFTIRGTGEAPEMDLTGTGTDNIFRAIADGAITTSTTNGTNFGDTNIGGPAQRRYTITNNGNKKLSITGRNFTGAAAADFTVSDLHAGNPFVGDILPSDTREFTITFNPSALGARNAVFSIVNDDPDENPYEFALTGTGIGFPEIRIQGRQTAHSPGNPVPTYTVIDDNDTTPAQTDGTLFRDTDVGSTFDMLVRVHNDGDANLTFSAPSFTGSTDFSLVGFTTAAVAPRDFKDFAIRFAPSSFGTKTATFSLPNNDGDENPYRFTIRGLGVAPDITIAGRSVNTAAYDNISSQTTSVSVAEGTDFGSVRVRSGDNENQFRIRNDGNKGLNLSNPRLDGPGRSHYSFRGVDALFNIGAGSSRDFTITFDPSGVGVQGATFLLDTNDPDKPTYSFALSGTGFGFPEIRVQGRQTAHPLNPIPTFTEIDSGTITTQVTDGTAFRDTNVGGTFDMLVRIHNDGDAPMTFSAPSFTGSSDFSVVGITLGALAPGSSRDFSIQCAPSSFGTKLATFSLPNNDSAANPFTFAIRCVGIGSKMEVRGGGGSFPLLIADNDTTPAAADGTLFGEVDPAGGSQTVPFQIINLGNRSLNITSATVDGAHPSDFTITNLPTSPLPKTLAANGGSDTFAIVFNPTALGTRNATITLNSNDSTTSPYIFAVRGVGQIPSAKPVIGVKGSATTIPNGDITPRTADGTDYGSPVAGSAPITRTFTIENTGTANLEIYGISSSNGIFTVTQTSSPNIAAAGSRTFTVTMTPTGAGLHSALITIFNNDSAASPFTFTVRANVQGSAVPFAMRSFSIDGTDLHFSYTAPPGVSYRLRRSPTMLPGSWTTVPGYSSMGSAAVPQTIVISDIINPALPKDFFRLEQNP